MRDRSRRIKCDEAKPECERCKWGGRKCGGYPSIFRHETANIILRNESSSVSSGSEIVLTPASYGAISPSPGLDPQVDLLPTERRALHHFLNRSALDFSESLACRFWQSYVPRLSTTSPAVRHAVITISALHEQIFSTSSTVDSCFALSQYQKAITAANSRFLDGNVPHSTVLQETLTACGLFAFIEVLLAENLRAYTHLLGGLQLISQLPAMDRTSLSQESAFSDLIELFTSYDSQALNSVGSLESTTYLAEISRQRGTIDWENLITQDIARGDLLEGIHKAATSLRHLVRESQHFMRCCAGNMRYEIDIPWEVTYGQQQQLAFFDSWHTRILSLLESVPKEDQTENFVAGLAPLVMQYHTTYLRLASCLSPNEIIYDDYSPSFMAIVSAAQDKLACKNLVRPKFTIESPIVEYIYIVALKCRNHEIRSRAIQAMRCCGGEGLWDGLAMAAVSETAMEVEEAWARDWYAVGLNSLSASESFDSSEGQVSYIPEECRIHTLSFDWDKKNRVLNIFDIRRMIDGNFLQETRVVKY